MTVSRLLVLLTGAGLALGTAAAPGWAQEGHVAHGPRSAPTASLESTIDSLISGVLPDPSLVRPVIPLADILPEAIRIHLAETVSLHPRLDDGQSDAIVHFYEERGYASLWIEGTQERPFWSARAKAVQGRIQAAGEDALEPSQYPLPPLGVVSRETMADLAKTELAIGISAVLY
ncbi:MAG TPA: hypothetical protein VLQ65_09670, partial [Saliniramus sp.]|nr:hypothetical protein [Saliniramus sp.]